MSERRASCSCGGLVAVVTGDVLRVSMCHCLACQKRTGSVFGAQARFRRGDVRIEGPSRAYTRMGDSGKSITFHFCPTCGATLHYELEEQPEIVAIPVGAFADPSFPAPARSVYGARKHAWVTLPPLAEDLD